MAKVLGPWLSVTDKDGVQVGRVRPRLGMKTYHGTVVGFTLKSVLLRADNGFERWWRPQNSRLPSVYRSYAGAYEHGVSQGGFALGLRA